MPDDPRSIKMSTEAHLAAAKSPQSATQNSKIKDKVEDLEGFDTVFVKRAIVGLTAFLNNRRDEGSDCKDLLARGEFLVLAFELKKAPYTVNPKALAM